jgi:tetratricopeptide (TPR) repeat protein
MFRGTARDQLQLASFYLERGRRLYDEGKDSEAVGELRKALYLSPYEAEAHLQLGRVYLRMGRVRQAIDTLRVAVWSRETVEGRIALATALLEARELDAARREAQRALALDPSSAAAQEVLSRLGKSE